MGEGHSYGGIPTDAAPTTPESSYFTHDGYSNMLWAHIVLMILSWVFALPLSSYLAPGQQARSANQSCRCHAQHRTITVHQLVASRLPAPEFLRTTLQYCLQCQQPGSVREQCAPQDWMDRNLGHVGANSDGVRPSLRQPQHSPKGLL